ncbi:hypothetical protein HMPREF0519_0748 [Lentilactobacillus hilgardii DSM 20176 = ATCC 8290]|uniref:Uncharacterized protein n=1 Tax=Lentilactobacillus hilgardii (strain ATCC 8290 / DSM 20176 / CCUG 30140 / JCM 1155 / KCTC 3500 / NBRC 15886 / NCIMB 8040 / NRRL B-1843 / 9) TaxID=1423757 RepID=C0XHN7_LENH9|nr:hypothetical protein HMPREF0519_0748 [Lentilactobacillus hilgardii DSM 20176 = ATCC 8290]
MGVILFDDLKKSKKAQTRSFHLYFSMTNNQNSLTTFFKNRY